MFRPSSVDLRSLPSLPLEMRSQLPKIPAIYFCLTPTNIAVYIGETSNLYRRWAKNRHDKERQCLKCGCNHIAWLAPVSEIRFDRLSIERELIKLYRPILNMQIWNGLRKHHSQQFYETTIPELDQKRKEMAEMSCSYWNNPK